VGTAKPAQRLETVTGVVLAGGQSTRMGTDKALLRLREQTLVELCLATLQECFGRNLVLTNHLETFAHLGVEIYADDVPGLGPLGGIVTALRRASTETVFIVACDMPFLNADLIRDMAAALAEFDAVAAKPGGKFEPLHAVYHRRVLPVIEARVAAGDYSVHRLLESLRVKSLCEPELSRYPDWRTIFLNVNTPEQFQRAQQLLKERISHGKQDG
jgi:molybdopterin-guanine dinucleotide biosynthesis protein A